MSKTTIIGWLKILILVILVVAYAFTDFEWESVLIAAFGIDKILDAIGFSWAEDAIKKPTQKTVNPDPQIVPPGGKPD